MLFRPFKKFIEIVVRFSSLKVFFVNSTESNTIEFNLRGASNAIFKFFLLNFLLNNELSFSLITNTESNSSFLSLIALIFTTFFKGIFNMDFLFSLSVFISGLTFNKSSTEIP